MEIVFHSKQNKIFGRFKSKYPNITLKSVWVLARKIVVITILCIIVIYLTIRLSTAKYIYGDMKEIPHTEVAVILGSEILIDGTLSPVLKDRVDMAIKLYNAKVVDNLLVTGDNSTLSYNEVNPVRIYLLQKGIPSKDIFLDHAGFDTYSSMYRARDIFLAKSMMIVSQSFHLPRAVFIARGLGINAYGMNADDGHYLMRNYVREIFADTKAFINILVNRHPKYLGKEIPITGSSADSI